MIYELELPRRQADRAHEVWAGPLRTLFESSTKHAVGTLLLASPWLLGGDIYSIPPMFIWSRRTKYAIVLPPNGLKERYE